MCNIVSENCARMMLVVCFGNDQPEEISPLYCAQIAYKDLARTVHYRQNSTEATSEFNSFKEGIKTTICELIIERINNYHCHQSDFDSWHESLCSEIKYKMNTASDEHGKLVNRDFTIGQAQKWLNMTLKYLWLLDHTNLIEAQQLHAPIDSYILEAIASDLECSEITNNNGTYQFRGNSWSQIDDYNIYMDIQRLIRSIHEVPIEWESESWIEIAKQRATEA